MNFTSRLFKPGSKLETVLFLLLLSIFSCTKDNPNPGENDPAEVVIPAGTADTLLHFTSIFDGLKIPVKVVFPGNVSSNTPAVVVLHGSGGGWDDDGTTAEVGELSSQNEDWAELLTANGYIAAFPESFYARGTVEAAGKWDEPPLKLKISAQGPRARDAIQTLELLCSLKNTNGSPLVDSDNVGVMGFSDGGTTVYNTVYDHPNATPEGFEWRYDGDIEMPEPESAEDHPRFAAAVAKYGGAGHHGFYGSVNRCEENIYGPYCPLRIELGEDDNLTENNLKLIGCMEAKGVGNLEYFVYPDAPHGLDTKDPINGPLSRQHTLEFFARYLKN